MSDADKKRHILKELKETIKDLQEAGLDINEEEDYLDLIAHDIANDMAYSEMMIRDWSDDL